MRLETPDKIRTLQRKLYGKAKAEPAFRFYLLYDKICREDILSHAYRLASAHAGAARVDGVTGAEHLAAQLQGLAIQQLRLAIAALAVEHEGQVVQAGERVGVARA